MLPIDSFNPRNLWPVLPLLTRLYILILFFTSVYVIVSLTQVLLGLRFLKRPSRVSSQEAIRPTLASLQARLANLRQLFFFSCLLFGFCLLLQIPIAFGVLFDSNRPLLSIIFMEMGTYIAYATDVLLLFLLLHLAQWFVSARVGSFARSQQLF